MDDPPLASLSLTHVHYNPEDPISHLCAWLSLIPQGLMVTYVTLIWATREAEVMLMFAGQMACEALNFGLKRWIKEERPTKMLGKGYGMPSSHAQFLSYFAVYISLFLLKRHKPTPPSTKNPTRMPLPSTATQHVIVSMAFVVVAAAVASSRIYLSYHTPKQVLVGCSAGIVSAIVCFAFTGWLRESGWLDWGLDFELAKLLRVRDLVLNEDLVESGWREWEVRRKKRKM